VESLDGSFCADADSEYDYFLFSTKAVYQGNYVDGDERIGTDKKLDEKSDIKMPRPAEQEIY